MTTTRSISLDTVGEALADAHKVVGGTTDEQLIEDALLALCRAAYDTLVNWEVGSAHAGREILTPETWRTPLDELRVQAALAEMELRVAGAQGRRVADRLAHAVTGKVEAARRDVGDALDSLRAEVSKVLA